MSTASDGPHHDLPSSPTSSSFQIKPTASAPRQRKHASTACEACQQAKRKCTGNPPCDSCTARDIECVASPDQDRRRKEARKRKIQDLQDDSDLLNELILDIRDSKNEHFGQIVSLIRSNAPLEDVKLCIKRQRVNARLQGDEQRAELDRLHDKINQVEQERAAQFELGTQQPSTGQYAAMSAQFTDDPPHKVPASPWTSVTADDLLVSELLSVWLSWDHGFYQWMDMPLFLHDMRRADLDSAFCSPFLVNAILAAACTYSDYAEARMDQEETSDLMAAFVEEAERLLEDDKSAPSITSAQGLMYLWMAYNVNGQDIVGHKFLGRAIAMCQQLDSEESTGVAEADLLLSRALDTTFWGVFNVLTMTSFVMQKPPEMIPPPRRMPQTPGDELQWTPYPRCGPSQASHQVELLNELSTLSLTIRDICLFLYSGASALSDVRSESLEMGVLRLHARLLQWRTSLPKHLSLETNSLPCNAVLLGYYLSLVIGLFRAIKQNHEGASAAIIVKASDLSRIAALEVVSICRTHQSLYGNAHMSAFHQYGVMQALLVLVDEPYISVYTAEILDLCVFLRACSRRWPFAMAALRMFQISCHQRGKKLPAETEILFEEFETREWRSRVKKKVISNMPAIGYTADGLPKVYNMQEFFEQMDNVGRNQESP